MKSLLAILAAVLLTLTAASVRAEESAYCWDDLEGGLVDKETGLVWGFGPSNITGLLFSYDAAVTRAGDIYAETEWGMPFTDWRCPTKDEMVDSAGKGMYWELCLAALEQGITSPAPLYENGFIAADPPFRVAKAKGSIKEHTYRVNLKDGAVFNEKITGVGRAIVVRQASGS